MGWGSSKPARDELKTARADLKKVTDGLVKKHGKGKAPETDEYLEANRKVIDAEESVPWYQR